MIITLPPDAFSLQLAFLERRWKPGQSGNPSGQTAEYGEVVALARSLSRRAIERLGELVEAADERVATVACNSILDRAFGKAQIIKDREEDREVESLVARQRRMTPDEREADARDLWERAQEVLTREAEREARLTKSGQEGSTRLSRPVERLSVNPRLLHVE